MEWKALVPRQGQHLAAQLPQLLCQHIVFSSSAAVSRSAATANNQRLRITTLYPHFITQMGHLLRLCPQNPPVISCYLWTGRTCNIHRSPFLKMAPRRSRSWSELPPPSLWWKVWQSSWRTSRGRSGGATGPSERRQGGGSRWSPRCLNENKQRPTHQELKCLQNLMIDDVLKI